MSPYITRSVTRRGEQAAEIVAIASVLSKKNAAGQLYTNGDLIELIRTALRCPDLMAHDPDIRNTMMNLMNVVYVECCGAHVPISQKLLAALEEYDMFMEQIYARPDFKA